MNTRSKTIVALTCLVATLTGCAGIGSNTSVLSKAQADQFADNTTAGLAALRDQGYTPLGTKTIGDRPVLLMRACGNSPTRESCLSDVTPSEEAPDIYLDVKDASASRLSPTGSYVLMFSASGDTNPANGLRCSPEPKGTKLSDAAVGSLKALGQKAHSLDYKTIEGAAANRTHTIEIHELWWRCDVTFDQTL